MKNNEERKSVDVEQPTISKHRRAVAKAGLIAPVFMTLLNRPAWGATRTLCSVSGFDSAKVQPGAKIFSGIVDENETCTEVSAIEHWKNNTPVNFDKTARFENIFTSSSFTGNPTFQNILNGGNSATSRDILYAGLYIDAFEASASSVSFVLGSPADVVTIYEGNVPNPSVFFDKGWFISDLDLYVDYLVGVRP